MDVDEVIARLRALANQEHAEEMVRVGISLEKALGVRVWDLRKLAKEIKSDHALARDLWETGIHEARILASIIGDPKQVTEAEMEAWVVMLDSWDVCDQVATNLWCFSALAHQKAMEWAARPEEFVKRAGFAIIAGVAWHDKKASDETFLPFLPVILREATDDRNFVKKAVNWALRNIGKRSLFLNAQAIETARQMELIDSKTARWNARDTLKELTGEAVQARLRKRSK